MVYNFKCQTINAISGRFNTSIGNFPKELKYSTLPLLFLLFIFSLVIKEKIFILAFSITIFNHLLIYRNRNVYQHTVLLDISPFDTSAPTMNSRAARSPIFDSIARFNKFLAVSAGLFLM